MPVDMVLHNAKIYACGRIVEAGLAIDDGRILKIGKSTNLPQASTKMNLRGHLTLPGLIDPHVHLRNQQLAYKEDFSSGTAAAAAGGVTLAVDMPNNQPVTMDSTSLRERMRLAQRRAVVNVAFYSAFPRKSEEIPSIVKEGAIAFKLYLQEKIGGLEVDDDKLLLQAFSGVANMGVPVAVHAEDRAILEAKRREMEKTERGDLEAYIEARPPEAEAQSIMRIVELAKKCGVHFHFCHISSAIGLDAFLKAKKDNLSVTCEVTPHHLLLSVKHLKLYRTFALTSPPLRTKKDITTLWGALKLGLIDALASDHAPHTLEEKEVESIWDVKPGIAGLETTLPLLLTEVSNGRLKITDLVRLTSKKPAEILNLKNRGCLKEGNWADIVVVDMKRKYKINASNFQSKTKFSPFHGWKIKGEPIKTFVNGQLVMEEGEIVGRPGTGQIVRWQNNQ